MVSYIKRGFRSSAVLSVSSVSFQYVFSVSSGQKSFAYLKLAGQHRFHPKNLMVFRGMTPTGVQMGHLGAFPAKNIYEGGNAPVFTPLITSERG